MIALSKQLLTKTAKYHTEKPLLRVNDLPQGTQSTVISNIHLGQLPKMVFCVLVDSNDFHGTKDRNPFFFKHHSMTQFSAQVDGKFTNLSSRLNPA
jgi:hypothetical protein